MAEYLNGWVKLHRRIVDWEWFKKPETLSLFIYCLTRANVADGSWRNIAYKRGQFITSLDTIRKDTGLSIQQARTALKHLVSTGELTSKSTNRFTIITVCKYDDYQSMSEDVNTPNNNKVTCNQHAKTKNSNKQSTTGEEEKEDVDIRRGRTKRKISSKEDKKKSCVTPPSFEEVCVFIRSESLSKVDAREFYDYYSDRGWKCGDRPLRDWKAKLREWQRRTFANTNSGNGNWRNGVAPAGYGIILPDGIEIH